MHIVAWEIGLAENDIKKRKKNWKWPTPAARSAVAQLVACAANVKFSFLLTERFNH